MNEIIKNNPLELIDKANDGLKDLQKNVIDDNLNKLELFGDKDKMMGLLTKVGKTLNVNLFGLGSIGTLLGVKIFNPAKYKEKKWGIRDIVLKNFGGIEWLHRSYAERMVGDYFVDQPEKSDFVKASYASYLEAKTSKVCADPLKDPDSLLVHTGLLLDEKQAAAIQNKLPTITFSALSETLMSSIKDKEATLDPAILAEVGLKVPSKKWEQGNEVIDTTSPDWPAAKGKIDKALIDKYLSKKTQKLLKDPWFVQDIQSPDHFVLALMGGMVANTSFVESVILGIHTPQEYWQVQEKPVDHHEYDGEVKKETTDYDTIVEVVIDRLEGGYYHPNMLKNGKVKDQRYSASGETMFGIDRKNGGSLNTSEAGKEFWGLIDGAKASSTWEWNYKWGELAPKLKTLTWKIIKPLYDSLSQKYLSAQALDLVKTDGRLMFNFIYGTWNGSGRFEKMAEVINTEVKKGTTDTEKLLEAVVNYRKNNKNSLIAQWGEKIEDIVGLA